MTTGESETDGGKEGRRERQTDARPSSIQSSGGEEGATDVGGLNCIAWLTCAREPTIWQHRLLTYKLQQTILSLSLSAKLSRGQAKNVTD